MQPVNDAMALITAAMARHPDPLDPSLTRQFVDDLERVMQGRGLDEYKLTLGWLAATSAMLVGEMADMLGMPPDDLLRDMALLAAQAGPPE